jgi:hypothetical protein
MTSRLLPGLLAVALLGGCATPGPAPVDQAPPIAAALLGACIARWTPQVLPGKKATRYAAIGTERSVVEAQATASASLLRHRLRVEPAALGRLRFSWQVPALLARADVRRSDSEDAVARVFLAFEGREEQLSTRQRAMSDLAETLSGERLPYATLMYVWNGDGPLGSVVVNGRSDRVRKIVVDAGPARLREWRHHERDIAADFRQAFGEEPGALVSVGLMTDADNTGGQATAWYGPVCLAPAAAGGR